MSHPSSSQPPPPDSVSENPVVAIGRKLKSALSSHQQPSVRIVRTSPNGESRRLPTTSQGIAEKPLPTGPEQSTFASRFAGVRNRLFGHGADSTQDEPAGHEYDQDTVNLLDVMDPEVATLSTLTNVQNSLFLPSLGKLVNRRATYKISESPDEERKLNKLQALLKKIPGPLARRKTAESNFTYAVLPDDEKLEGWTREDKAEMDDMVRHQLHSRRAKFKRSMRGFKQYVRRPMGLFITVYATLITLFGAAWVFFLIGWISLGSKSDYVIDVVDNVLVALFAIIGDGLAPFRAVDTYHMIYIAHYHRISWKRREQQGLPDLADRNDLPDQRVEDIHDPEVDIESLVARKMPRSVAKRIAPRIPKRYATRMIVRSRAKDPVFEYSVLNEEEQAKLDHHERKFSKSHTFYKPHETETHYAFPLKLLVAVVLLLDLHSCLQISLGACTWGIPHERRPFALTTVILCFSITANITAGILISRGDKKTRKKDVIERIMRQELTADAIEQIQRRHMKEAEQRGEIDPAVRRRIEEEKERAQNEEIKKSWKSVPSLPKKLLGKGEDHRQPALPQSARRSGSNVAVAPTASSSSGFKKFTSGSDLPAVREDARPVPPLPAVERDEDPIKPSIARKAVGLLRKADLDRS